jgi:hypothetical protein
MRRDTFGPDEVFNRQLAGGYHAQMPVTDAGVERHREIRDGLVQAVNEFGGFLR